MDHSEEWLPSRWVMAASFDPQLTDEPSENKGSSIVHIYSSHSPDQRLPQEAVCSAEDDSLEIDVGNMDGAFSQDVEPSVASIGQRVTSALELELLLFVSTSSVASAVWHSWFANGGVSGASSSHIKTMSTSSQWE